MIERHDLIEHWMKPASKADILKEVASLTPVMKLRNWNKATSSAIMETYAGDLADQPLFAIQNACTAFRRNFVGEGWMPNPGELLVECKKKAEWLREEGVEIGRVLNAEIVTEAPKVERASVRARVDALKAELKSARPKNETARGFKEERPTDDHLTPDQRLEKVAKTYRDSPVTFSGSVNINRRPLAA